MTTKIPFSDVLKAIKVFVNFNPDCFPIIISLDNHCSLPYQEVMADHFVNILGESLFIPDDSKLQELNGQIPSPERYASIVHFFYFPKHAVFYVGLFFQ